MDVAFAPRALLAELVEKRQLTVLWELTVEITLKVLAERLLRAVREGGVQRLFLDGFDAFSASDRSAGRMVL